MSQNFFDFSHIPFIVAWAAEYRRTTGKVAQIISFGSGWYASYSSGIGCGQKMRKSDFIAATARLKLRPSKAPDALVRLAKIRRGGRCTFPSSATPDRVWRRRTGGFVEFVCHEAVKHSYLAKGGIDALVRPVDYSDLSIPSEVVS